jgi:hypothetical protein
MVFIGNTAASCCAVRLRNSQSNSLEKLTSSLDISQISGSESDKEDSELELETVKSPSSVSEASSTGRHEKALLLLMGTVLFLGA